MGRPLSGLAIPVGDADEVVVGDGVVSEAGLGIPAGDSHEIVVADGGAPVAGFSWWTAASGGSGSSWRLSCQKLEHHCLQTLNLPGLGLEQCLRCSIGRNTCRGRWHLGIIAFVLQGKDIEHYSNCRQTSPSPRQGRRALLDLRLRLLLHPGGAADRNICRI